MATNGPNDALTITLRSVQLRTKAYLAYELQKQTDFIEALIFSRKF